MTPRAAGWPGPVRLLAALAAAALLLTGCGGSDRDAQGQTGRAQDSVDQSTPGAAAVSYFEAVRDARFGQACELLAPAARDRYAAAGQDCATGLAELFDEATRSAIGEVAADEGLVDVVGDTATVRGEALTRTDLPDGAPPPSFPTVRATLQGGKWLLVP